MAVRDDIFYSISKLDPEPRNGKAKQEIIVVGVKDLQEMHQKLPTPKRRATNKALPQEAVNQLMCWLEMNLDKPYPTESTKMLLAKDIGLTKHQVRNACNSLINIYNVYCSFKYFAWV